jgi:hypothetical protein
MNALDTEERRLAFSSWWGAAFERACLATLQSIFGSRRWTFVANPRHPRSGDELWDAIAVRPDSSAIVFECEGTFMQANAKYAGVPLDFFRGLNRKYGRKKRGAIQQLTRGILATWGTNSPPELQNWTRVSDVFPVVVAQDPILNVEPVARLLSDRFNKEMEGLRLRAHVRVWPLTVLSGDGLDLLHAVVATSGEPVHQVLKSFHRQNRSRMTLLEDFLRSDSKRFVTGAVSVRISTRFREVADATMRRFETQAFSGSSPREGR